MSAVQWVFHFFGHVVMILASLWDVISSDTAAAVWVPDSINSLNDDVSVSDLLTLSAEDILNWCPAVFILLTLYNTPNCTQLFQ